MAAIGLTEAETSKQIYQRRQTSDAGGGPQRNQFPEGLLTLLSVREKLGVALANEMNWQKILDLVNNNIKSRDHRLSETKELAELSAQLYAVKVAWRNEVMHPKRTYTIDDAMIIFENVRLFLKALVLVI
jgi:hypothetical protein